MLASKRVITKNIFFSFKTLSKPDKSLYANLTNSWCLVIRYLLSCFKHALAAANLFNSDSCNYIACG